MPKHITIHLTPKQFTVLTHILETYWTGEELYMLTRTEAAERKSLIDSILEKLERAN